MIKRSSEQRVGSFLKGVMVLFVFIGVGLMALGFRTFIHGSGPIEYEPSHRAKLTPAPQIQIIHNTEVDKTKDMPRFFTVDGAEVAGVPQATEAKDVSVSEPGAGEEKSQPNVDIGFGGAQIREGAKPSQTIISVK